ncbi:UbiA family prenyltransferase [Halanaerocella petrolearia]
MLTYKKIKGLIELLRPELPFAAGICVIIGEIITLGNFPSLSELFMGFIWGFFLSGSAMILNDFFDIEVDRVNAPNRPLPSGLISLSTAIVFTIIITLIGLVASFFINRLAVFLYIIFWVIGFLYNWKLKEKGLLGNLFVSSSVAITIILGGIVVGELWNNTILIFSIMVFIFNLGEEIAADAMDIEGDKKRNIKSIAILIGRKNALYISFSLFVFEIVLSFLPVILGFFGISYLIIISLTDIMILFLGIKLIKSQTIKKGRIYIRMLYFSALLGMFLSIISMMII